MKRTICIINLILLSVLSLTAQNNFIVCGKPNVENDIFTDIQDTLIQPGLPQYGSGAISYFYIDFYNNSINDFSIKTYANLSGVEGYYISIEPLDANNTASFFIHPDSVLEDPSQNPPTFYYLNYNVAMVHSYGDTIDNRYDYSNGSTFEERIFLTNTGPFSDAMDYFWLNIGEKYIGVSMQVNDVTLYGWILVEVTDYFSVIVKEFACNKNPYIGIAPGAAAQAFELYPNPAKNEVYIKLKGENAGKTARFTLYDLIGKKLLQVGDIPQNGHIALPALAKGLYVAEIVVEGQREIRKFQIQ